MIEARVKKVIAEQKQAESSKQNHIDHIVACPDCYKAVIKKMNETSRFKCSDCGLPWGSSEEFAHKLGSCPNCGHERGVSINRE